MFGGGAGYSVWGRGGLECLGEGWLEWGRGWLEWGRGWLECFECKREWLDWEGGEDVLA